MAEAILGRGRLSRSRRAVRLDTGAARSPAARGSAGRRQDDSLARRRRGSGHGRRAHAHRETAGGGEAAGVRDSRRPLLGGRGRGRRLRTPQAVALRVALLLEPAGASARPAWRRPRVPSPCCARSPPSAPCWSRSTMSSARPPSAAVLAFAAQRLEDEPVGFRGAAAGGATGGAARRGPRPPAVPPCARARLSALEATGRPLRDRLGLALPRPTVTAVHELSGGNPFYALEIARTLDDATHAPGEPLSVPATLSEPVGARATRRCRRTPATRSSPPRRSPI